MMRMRLMRRMVKGPQLKQMNPFFIFLFEVYQNE